MFDRKLITYLNFLNRFQREKGYVPTDYQLKKYIKEKQKPKQLRKIKKEK